MSENYKGSANFRQSQVYRAILCYEKRKAEFDKHINEVSRIDEAKAQIRPTLFERLVGYSSHDLYYRRRDGKGVRKYSSNLRVGKPNSRKELTMEYCDLSGFQDILYSTWLGRVEFVGASAAKDIQALLKSNAQFIALGPDLARFVNKWS